MMSIKETEFPSNCFDNVLDWWNTENPDTPADIDPDLTFVDLYFGIVNDELDVFIACGEDNDVKRDCIEELACRMDIDFDELYEKTIGW